jgi:hypothetical protein
MKQWESRLYWANEYFVTIVLHLVCESFMRERIVQLKYANKKGVIIIICNVHCGWFPARRSTDGHVVPPLVRPHMEIYDHALQLLFCA